MKQRSDYYGRGDIALNMLSEIYQQLLFRTVAIECLA
jgi:hypothetical protein